VGQEYQDVITDPQYQDFNITISEYRASETVESGYIIDQTPNANTTAKGEKPEIKVVVSSGVDYIPLENYENQDYRTVLSKLTELGLHPRAEAVESDTATPDYVVSTSPAEGSFVKKGEEVVIYYSKGPAVQPVTVISFIGMTVEAAEKRVAELGLNMGTSLEVNSDQEKGTIVQQSIDPNEEVAPGTVISFQVSLGPKEEPPTTPTPPPSDEPTASPSSQKFIAVTLPHGDGTVQVKVTLDGQTVYEQDITMSGTTMNIPVTGSGSQTAAIYFDGQFQNSYQVDFGE
jgi:serine/threonine-protein kinase